jgi:hypothetical protein
MASMLHPRHLTHLFVARVYDPGHLAHLSAGRGLRRHLHAVLHLRVIHRRFGSWLLLGARPFWRSFLCRRLLLGCWFRRHRHGHARHVLMLRRGGRGELGKRKRARRNEQIRLHNDFSGEGGDAGNAPPPRSCLQLLGAALRMLRAMAFMLGGHVLAAVLAAIHALVLAGLAHLHVLLVLSLRIARSRSSGLGSGGGGRDHQRHHDSILLSSID